MPAGTSQAWPDYRVDCSRCARQEQQRGWQDVNSPTRACLDGRFGAPVPDDEYAFPDALRQWRETSAAADAGA